MFTNDIIKSEKAFCILDQKLKDAMIRWNILTRSGMTTTEAAKRMYDVVTEWIDEQTVEIKFMGDEIDGGLK